MPNLTQLRIAAREIFDEALLAVDAGGAVRGAIGIEGSTLIIQGTPFQIPVGGVYSVAIGKAAYRMASALDVAIGDSLRGGVISGVPSSAKTIHQPGEHWLEFAGGHPLPNEASIRAAQAAMSLIERASSEHALIIYLISGGGSAMFEAPASELISLEDLRTANRVLVNSGAAIAEINSVRRAFSAVKGGKLAQRARHCDQVTLIISDVPTGEEGHVASGPTMASARGAPNVRDLIAKYDLARKLPPSIIRAIETQSGLEPEFDSGRHQNFVLLENTTALKAAVAAAQNRGFIAEIAADIADQPIAEGCELLINRLDTLRQEHRDRAKPVCLISGGEFACPVRGGGLGGRNLETALRLASALEAEEPATVALCAGTDGIDGNSPAAGAIIDGTTTGRARSIGNNPNDFLGRSDSYSFFVAIGDAVTTGSTGTNVRDVRILLADSALSR